MGKRKQDAASAALARPLGITAACLVMGLASAIAQPANDDFSNRAIIPAPGAVVSNFIGGATVEFGESINPALGSGQTAWWSWTAPSNGQVSLSVAGDGFVPLLEVFTGPDLAGLSQVASNNHLTCYESTNCGCHWRFRNFTRFHVTRDVEYEIRVDSAVLTDASMPIIAIRVDDTNGWPGVVATTNVLPAGQTRLDLRFSPAPKNDDLENAIPLKGSRFHIQASNEGATKQPGEPIHSGNPGGSSVWYVWAASASGRVTLSINEIAPFDPPRWHGSYGVFILDNIRFSCGGEIDQSPLPVFFPVFASYTGATLDSLTSANCIPLDLLEYPYAVSFDAVKGTTYRIAYDGSMGTTGSTPLYLALTKPAFNDNFSRRIRIRGTYIVATGYNAGATSQPDETLLFGNSTGKTVWWSWRAPVSGTVTVDLSARDYTFPVAVLSGSRIGSLTLLQSGMGSLSFEAVAGQSYEIAVGDAAGRTGGFKLTLRAPLVEIPLVRTLSRSARVALLRYEAPRGQVVLLMRSDDGVNWQNVRTATARRNFVDFLVYPAPSASGTQYRAVLFDQNY